MRRVRCGYRYEIDPLAQGFLGFLGKHRRIGCVSPRFANVIVGGRLQGTLCIARKRSCDDRGSIVQTSRNRMDLADKRSRPSPYKPHVQFSIERSIGHLVACSKKGNEERKADAVCSTKPKTIFQIRIENQTRSLLFPQGFCMVKKDPTQLQPRFGMLENPIVGCTDPTLRNHPG